jgi:hypothetical protein
MAKYPNLNTQYQGVISDLVDLYTSYGIVAILGLALDLPHNLPLTSLSNRSPLD